MSSEGSEDHFDGEPPEINPYEVLGLEKDATPDHVKNAYRKAALRHHPDKAPDHLKAEAHTKFQSVAFAYAVLSDPLRRKRFDTTGSTSESVVDSDDFNWSDFYNEQFKDAISGDAIEKFAKQYKGSDEEKDDILAAFEQSKGSMAQLYTIVMLSDPNEDEDRFREIIDEAIESGDIEAFKAYTKETKKQMQHRIKSFYSEGDEAMKYAKELGVADVLFKKGGKPSGEDALMAMIQKKQQDRGSSFLDQLEAKYAPKAKATKGRKRAAKEDFEGDEDDEPSEEAFQAAASRLRGNKENGKEKTKSGAGGKGGQKKKARR